MLPLREAGVRRAVHVAGVLEQVRHTMALRPALRPRRPHRLDLLVDRPGRLVAVSQPLPADTIAGVLEIALRKGPKMDRWR